MVQLLLGITVFVFLHLKHILYRTVILQKKIKSTWRSPNDGYKYKGCDLILVTLAGSEPQSKWFRDNS